MAIQKICGIETEYGIIVRGVAESNPIAASSVLINAYLHSLGPEGHRGEAPKVGWDFEDESPGRDARGGGALGPRPGAGATPRAMSSPARTELRSPPARTVSWLTRLC